MPFSIRVVDLHWIQGGKDEPDDLCLHGKVEAVLGEEILDNGRDNGIWCLSAGAYRMLQSLFAGHTMAADRQMIPCCGHFMLIDEQTDELMIIGCDNGIDWEVLHTPGQVTLTSGSGTKTVLPLAEYQKTVLSFARVIEAFYARCTPKRIPQEAWQQAAYERFWETWKAMMFKAGV